MAKQGAEFLQPQELEFLDHAAKIGQITTLDLPVGISIGLDSMGPVRDPNTDNFFPGTREVLERFREPMRRYNLTLILATNGPDIEGEDVLRAVFPDVGTGVRAFAVTEGGGRLINSISAKGTGLEYTNMADEQALERLKDVEEAAANRSKVMEALLEDREGDDEDAPTRTGYHTNIVFTLPKTFGTLQERLERRGIEVEAEIEEVNPDNYLKRMLDFSASEFRGVLTDLDINDLFAPPLIKIQNRRVYLSPKYLVGGVVGGGELSKMGGAVWGSKMLMFTPEFRGYSEYHVGNSIYIADKAVDVTSEGQMVIGASERSMILDASYFYGSPEPGVRVGKVYNRIPGVGPGGEDLVIADIGTRLAINVTMDDRLPEISEVEGIKVLNIRSGNTALEAVTHLYQRLHG